MTTENTDLVIVGGGIAGLVAANRALDLGLRAHVLEAQLEAKYPCATRMSGGVFHVIFRSVATPPDELYKAIVEGTEGYADLTLARAIADNAARAVDWLRAHGIIFGRLDSDSGWDDKPRVGRPGLRRVHARHGSAPDHARRPPHSRRAGKRARG